MPNIAQTQDCREAWCCLYYNGTHDRTCHSRYHAFPNTLQVAGESGLGKTTFINTLFSTTIKNYADHKRRHNKQVDKTVEIEITKAELEEKFFKGTSAHNPLPSACAPRKLYTYMQQFA
jgi:septin family protein